MKRKGQVYCARDTKRDRDVALNPPSIARIHGLEESSGVRAVMELVEGPTLAALIDGMAPAREL